jgi:tRNA threonylcarbamoyladenosine biosynthesis protein TsaE
MLRCNHMLKAGLVNHYKSFSAEETKALGKKVGSLLEKGDVISLFGDLGAGKTTFLKGLIPAVTKKCDEFDVKSPTFLTMQYYEGIMDLAHFDLYRLLEAQDFFDQGFDEYLGDHLVTCIEWPEKIKQYLPKKTLYITFSLCPDNNEKRLIKIDLKDN